MIRGCFLAKSKSVINKIRLRVPGIHTKMKRINAFKIGNNNKTVLNSNHDHTHLWGINQMDNRWILYETSQK